MLKKRLISAVMVLIMMAVLASGAVVYADVKTVSVSTAEELKAAIASDTTIILNAGTYTYEYALRIFEVENLSIIGSAGTKIVSTSYEDTVISLSYVKNISISNVFIGHDVPSEGGCSAGVIDVYSAENLSIENCEIYGCGTEGFQAAESKIRFSNCIIRDCSYKIGSIYNAEIVFDGCIFKDNGYGNDAQGMSYGYKSSAFSLADYDGGYPAFATFNDCSFINNNNSFFKTESGSDLESVSSYAENTYNIGFTRVNNCTFTDNTWQKSDAPAAEPAFTAVPTSSTVLVNGVPVAFDAYNISDNNYFKLRDLAFVLMGTEKEFGVSWDGDNNAILLTKNSEYLPVGGEMAAGSAVAATAVPTSSTIMVDGEIAYFTAYKINDNNYFKLRDIGETFDFGVIWDGENNTIVIDTSIGYTP